MTQNAVRVRRFENGDVQTIAIRSLERAGFAVVREPSRGKGFPPPDKWKVSGKLYEHNDIVWFANKVRIARGEEPLISPKRARSA
jgi:hypothetical protein